MGTSVTSGLQRRGVRIPEFAIGLLIVSSCVVGAFLWQGSQADGTPVLVTARPLQQGHQIVASDLATITLTSSADIALLSDAMAADIIGMRVINDMVSGTPFTTAQLTAIEPLSASEGLVGMTITLAQAPADLMAGDYVQLIAVDSQSDGSQISTAIDGRVQVWSISSPQELSSERSVTLRVTLAASLTLVGHDELHLIKVVN